MNAADLKSRVVDLESGNGEHTFVRAPGYSMDDFNSLIDQRVDELLSQVRLHLLPLFLPEKSPQNTFF